MRLPLTAWPGCLQSGRMVKDSAAQAGPGGWIQHAAGNRKPSLPDLAELARDHLSRRAYRELVGQEPARQ